MAYFTSVSNPMDNVTPPISLEDIDVAMKLVDKGATIREASQTLGVPYLQLKSKLAPKRTLNKRVLKTLIQLQGRLCSTIDGSVDCTKKTIKVVQSVVPGMSFFNFR